MEVELEEEGQEEREEVIDRGNFSFRPPVGENQPGTFYEVVPAFLSRI